MAGQVEQIHELDKKIVILQHEMTGVKDALSGFIEKLESLFATQTELLNSAMPDFESTKEKVNEIDGRVSCIEKRHEIEDIDKARRARMFAWSLKNWRVVIGVIIILGGAYEAGRTLYMAPSPKYNAHKVEK